MKQSVLLAILLSICPAAWSATYYVSAAGSNVPPFADWGNAATNLADAAAYANLDPAGGTVLVTAGVYNIDATIALTNARLRGFSGLAGDVVAAGDGSVRCFYLNHAQAELAHITVSNGLAEPGLLGNGGGVYLNNGTVTNCAITHCAATNNGGGIYMTTGLVAACAIHDNQSRTPTAGPYGGGGIYVAKGALLDSVLYGNIASNNGGGVSMLTGMVANCTVSNNQAYGIGSYNYRCGGGGIYMESGLVSNCVIAGNTDHQQGAGGEKGAGGIFFGLSAPNYGGTITDSIVSNNNTIGRAGGIVVIYGPERHLLRCVVCDNQSIQVGGVLWMSSTNGMLSHCSILRNTGGYAGGAYCPTYGGTIRNCLVEGNMSASGAGGISVSANNNTLRMQSLTIAGNSATNTGTGTSGGVNTSNSTNILVENCIIHSNMAVYADNRDLRFGSGLSASNYFFNTCSSRNLAPDQGNITNAPLFAAAAAGDYRLEADSPGVNAGINQEWMAGNVDLQGYSRIDQMNRLTDMGCYEYLPRGFLFRLR